MPQRLDDAQTKLRRALEHLHVLRCAAVSGHYDPVAFERAMSAYREANAEVRQARAAGRCISTGDPPSPGAVLAVAAHQPPAASREPLESTPRLRFVKWLVETGRLSD